MLARFTSLLILLVPFPAWAQVAPGASGGGMSGGDDQMMVPAPASGDAYSKSTGLETRSNYFLAGIYVDSAYLSNLFPSQTSAPVNDTTFSFVPNFQLERSTARQKESLSYSPSFVIYAPTTVLDSVNQNASVDFSDRLSPGFTFSAEDTFFRTSNVFDQSSTFSQGGVTGSTATPAAGLIIPFAEQLSNTSKVNLTYQFGRNGMIGGGGSYLTSDFPDTSSSAAGISNSRVVGADLFYNRRLSKAQYFGLSYQYTQTVAKVINQQSTTQSNGLLPYYAYYFGPTVSVSVSVGVERVDIALPQSQTFTSWSPEGVVSAGWQSERVSVAGSYYRAVTSGQGLFGAFTVNGANATGTWQLAQTWSVVLSTSYTTSSNVTPLLSLYSGGTTISGQASISHAFSERFNMNFGYDRLQQDYPGINVITESPDNNEVFARFSYQFTKPLGR